MKQITVTIPGNKEILSNDPMKSLSFVKAIDNIESMDIPEWHKAIVDQRVENYKENPESYRDWEEVQKEINQKYGL